jgi:hypothetical protein
LYVTALADPEADTWPLPWWLDYLLDAEAAKCPPWELFDGWTSRRFWGECIRHLRVARSIVEKKKEQADVKAVKGN